MVTLIIVLVLCLIGVSMYAAYLNGELNRERHRRYEAEVWIDPVSLEESK